MPEKLAKNEDYFAVQKRSLRYAGLSLERDEGFAYKIYVCFIFLLRLSWLFLLIGEIFQNAGDLDVVIKVAIFIFGIGMESSKALTLYANRAKLGRACELLQSGIFAPNPDRGGPAEEEWLRDCIESGKWQAYVGGLLGLVAVSLLGTVCYVKKLSTDDPNKWDLPYGKSTIIDVTYSPNYEIVLVTQTFALYLAALTYITTDLLLSNILAIVTTQCRLLQNFINRSVAKSYRKMMKEVSSSLNPNPDNNDFDQSIIPWKYLQETLVEIIEYHNAVVDISKEFEKIFEPVMLIEHVGVLLVLSCVMYDASLFPVTDPRFLPDFAIAVAVLLQVCAIGYWGSEVLYESELIGRACYEADFVGTDLRFQKSWALVIQRAQRPITFTVGKFTSLTVVTSITMLKAAVSYFMVLRNRNERE